MRVLFTDNEENCSQDKVLMEDREFEAGNILMAVPLDFQEMEEWRKAALYPWEKRPELILQNKEGTVHMTLQLLKREWPETETFQAVLEMGRLLEGTFPVYEQSEVYLMETEKSVIGWLILKMKERE